MSRKNIKNSREVVKKIVYLVAHKHQKLYFRRNFVIIFPKSPYFYFVKSEIFHLTCLIKSVCYQFSVLSLKVEFNQICCGLACGINKGCPFLTFSPAKTRQIKEQRSLGTLRLRANLTTLQAIQKNNSTRQPHL